MARRRTVLLIVLGVLALVAAAAVTFLLLRDRGAAAPTATGPSVTIDAPAAGEQVFLGRPVMVHAVASGPAKIMRVEVWVGAEVLATQVSALPGGASPLPVTASWEPAEAGAQTLVARAFDAEGRRSDATLAVGVVPAPAADRDGDGTADDADTCPDEPGWASTAGCPDLDGDGIADGADACPDVAGLGDGCPAPSDTDRDGDGAADASDECPEVPGAGDDGGCVPPGDTDGDGIADDADTCPDESGSPETGGCPDRDGDGIPDASDECPDVAGPPDAGCPAPGDGDRDGDGVPDLDDGCPDEPGPGSAGGCPGAGPPGSSEDDDSDGDGLPDASDSCPGAPGAAGMEGCPDVDGDGVPDYRDMCPDEAGTVEASGCPDTGAGDADGDGVPDDVDLCPEDPGTPEGLGCPSAPEDAAEADDAAEPFAEMHALRVVEFQALSLQVSDGYDGVSCYPSLAGAPVERYALEALGEQRWDVAADLGSRTLAVEPDEPIAVRMECGADVVSMGAEGGWGTYWNLGEVAGSHDPATWDGRTFTVTSAGGDEGRSFEVQYRLCAGSCESGQKAVVLERDGSWLTWVWDEAIDQLAGYRVYVNGAAIATLRATSATASFDIGRYAPPCGTTWEYTVTALWRDGTESMPSNMVTWTAEACPRLVRVTFDSLTTFDLGNDQGRDDVGPILGSFTATGSTSEVLEFNGVDYGNWWGEPNRGYRLRSTRYYPVQSIFDTIGTWAVNSMMSPYYAPSDAVATLELGPEDDLTFGAQILDEDDGTNPTDTLFNATRTIAAEDVRPGRYRLWDRNIELAVVIDVVVGPEAGEAPDLAITDVARMDDGALQVSVFNNAQGMAEPVDLTVEWTDVVTGDVVRSEVWPDVQIPSGGVRILTTADDVGPIAGMRFVLDPAEAVADGNRANNVFETPVVMRVELLGTTGSNCSELTGCDTIFNCDWTEWVYGFWTGYGASQEEIRWVARNARFPASGELTTAGHRWWEWRESPAEDWIAEGNSRYAFEFEVPAAEDLFVMATATEVDFWTPDDAFGTALSEFGAGANWGARAEAYTEDLTARESCDDPSCLECWDHAVQATWRITRVE